MMVTIEIPVDEKKKVEFEEIMNDIGLDLDTAVRMILSACIRFRGIPFVVRENISVPDPEFSIEDTNGGV
jgi:addiction module RelB/DinJ family antitoxin